MLKALKPKGQKKEEKVICPTCGKEVVKYSFKCPYCGRILLNR